MVTKFKGCAVDVASILCVTKREILFVNGTRIEADGEAFNDVIESFGEQKTAEPKRVTVDISVN